MTTLVIGAGLVGAQVARLLVEDGERPVLLDHSAQPQAVGQIVDPSKVVMMEGDVLRPLSIMKAIGDHKISSIIHTAAYPLLTLGAQREPYAAINLNIMGTVNVLEAARVAGIKRVVVSSSSVLCSFFEGGEGEGDLMQEEALPRPTTFYAATKQAVESLGLNYARWCGIEFAGMRYGAVFGPWNGAGGGGPSNTVRQALRDAMAGREAKVPEAAMEWVYSKDAARGTVLALRAKDLGSRIFNITMGSLTQPADMAEAIKRAVPQAKVKFETPPATALSLPTARQLSNPAKAKVVLGYIPQFGLDDAVGDMAEWMRANPA
jgi:nucleoside-diphosphate-sugar epimerase